MGLALQLYDFDIVHRPGRIHGNADCLTRRPRDSCIASSPNKEESQIPKLEKCKNWIPSLVQ